MRIRIQKWGNSLALRIPKAFAVQSKIKEDEYVTLSLKENQIVIIPEPEKKYTLKELTSAINLKNLHKEIDSGNKTGAEIW